MSIYYAFIFLFLFMSLFYGNSDKLTQSFLNFLFLVICIITFGTRFEVGADWFNYARIYDLHNTDLNFYSTIEVGYKGLNVISFITGLGYQFVIFCSSIIFFSCTFYSAKRLNLNPYLFFALIGPYHLVMSGMNYTRQSIALSFFILGYSFLITSNKRKGFALLFCSVLFHKSSVLMMSLFFADMKKRFSIPLSFGVLLFFFYSIFDEYSGRYLETAHYDSKGFLLRYLYLFICTSFIFLLNKSVKWSPALKDLKLLQLIFTVLIFIISFFSTTAADRLSYYFILSGTLLLMYLLSFNMKVKKTTLQRVLLGSLFFVSFSVLIVWDNFGSISQYYKYNSMLSTLL